MIFIKTNTKSGLERVVRMLGVLAVFAIVAWAFWVNNERTIKMIQARGVAVDQTDTMGINDKRFFRSFKNSLEKNYGLGFKIIVFKGNIEVPELDKKTVFMGLSPSTGETEIILPPLVQKALGGDFVPYLVESHFPGYMEAGNWIEGAKTAVALMWERLSGIESETQDNNKRQ